MTSFGWRTHLYTHTDTHTDTQRHSGIKVKLATTTVHRYTINATEVEQPSLNSMKSSFIAAKRTTHYSYTYSQTYTCKY